MLKKTTKKTIFLCSKKNFNDFNVKIRGLVLIYFKTEPQNALVCDSRSPFGELYLYMRIYKNKNLLEINETLWAQINNTLRKIIHELYNVLYSVFDYLRTSNGSSKVSFFVVISVLTVICAVSYY